MGSTDTVGAVAAEPEYDAFISYSSLDGEWVRSELVPALESNGIRVIIDSMFDIGVPIEENIANAVKRSRHIIPVVSANWRASDWSNYELSLAGVRDPAARRRLLLPILLGDCSLPDRLGTLTYADFRREENRSREMERLLKSLLDDKDVGRIARVPVERKPPTEEEAGLLLSQLAGLMVRSGKVSQTAGRMALCYQIGVRPGTVNTEGVPSDFAEQLTFSLYDTGNTAAIIRLCDRLAPVLKGEWSRQLSNIRSGFGGRYAGTAD